MSADAQRSPNVRHLIRQALNEACEEFVAIVDRKLEALFGDENRSGSRGPADRAKRHRYSPSDVEALESNVLLRLKPNEWTRRQEVMRTLSAVDGTRVTFTLTKLRSRGLIEMRGNRATAEYRLKGDDE